MNSELLQPVSKLRGVGETVGLKLKKLGVETVWDLINYYPRRYDDFSLITPIAKAKPGQITIQGEIKRAVTHRTRRRGFTITEAVVDDGTGALKAMWFNQPYLASGLPKDIPVFMAGVLESKYDRYSLMNPVVERVSAFPKDTARIVPVYPETAGLTSRQIRGLIKQVLPAFKDVQDILPKEILTSFQGGSPPTGQAGLETKAEALRQIHFPDTLHKFEAAKHRLAFEELFELILTSLIIKQEIQTEAGPKIKFNAKVAKDFVASLPFKLTDAQRKVAWEILQDLDKTIPMNRLLQGDVGSGKTVVAAMAAVMAVAAGYQVALLAPTEILAKQHFQNLQKLLPKLELELVVGGSRVTKVTSDLAIGTHALVQQSVNFKNLGLAIVDEQHRFGVNQRAELKKKAGKLPHLLTMSATPIPRSLALTIYGDLDVSVINQVPPGRKAVTTKLASDKQRADVYKHVDEQIKAGRQVYVVTPLISESDRLAVKSVEAEAERLKNSVFRHRRIGVLHGQMKAEQKEAVMAKFVAGEIDILVSTTVVEVGVDVPNASVMLVEGAERFGLATLHQLRGRVGRAEHQSYCYLIASKDKQAQYRLELLEQYNDGFVLAQKDMEIRGPGAIYGTRQHGLLDLRMANLADTKFIAEVRKTALDYLASKPKMPKVLVDRINQLKSVTRLD